jgi:DNA repair ATPase RecN
METALQQANAGAISQIRAEFGAVLVERMVEVLEDWQVSRAELPVRVQWTDKRQQVGDRIMLTVSVDHDEPGMLLHVCLPPALA